MIGVALKNIYAKDKLSASAQSRAFTYFLITLVTTLLEQPYIAVMHIITKNICVKYKSKYFLEEKLLQISLVCLGYTVSVATR